MTLYLLRVFPRPFRHFRVLPTPWCCGIVISFKGGMTLIDLGKHPLNSGLVIFLFLSPSSLLSERHCVARIGQWINYIKKKKKNKALALLIVSKYNSFVTNREMGMKNLDIINLLRGIRQGAFNQRVLVLRVLILLLSLLRRVYHQLDSQQPQHSLNDSFQQLTIITLTRKY